MEEYILAGIVGTASVALLLTLIVSLASLFSSHRTMKIMREGAEIAIAAMGQQDTGRAEAQMAKTYAEEAQQSIFDDPANMGPGADEDFDEY
jgi:hypothetical protein